MILELYCARYSLPIANCQMPIEKAPFIIQHCIWHSAFGNITKPPPGLTPEAVGL